MEREWFTTVQMLQIEIGVVVALALIALLAFTARLARDRSEPAGRRLLDRAGIAGPATQHPVQANPTAIQAAAVEAKTVTEHQPATPEWLDRLLGRPQQVGRPAGNRLDLPGARSGQRVA